LLTELRCFGEIYEDADYMARPERNEHATTRLRRGSRAGAVVEKAIERDVETDAKDRSHRREAARMRTRSVAVVSSFARSLASSAMRNSRVQMHAEKNLCRVGRACALFLTKPSALWVNFMPPVAFFAYTQELWISLWTTALAEHRKAHR
jgi:hypothetical protein